MAKLTMAELREENDGLLRLVVRLSGIILQNVAEQRELLDIHGGEVDPRVLVAMTPAEFVPRLREVSLRCAQLGRDCSDRPTAQGLEELGVQLAVEAEKLEAVLAARHAGMSRGITGNSVTGRHSLTPREREVLAWVSHGKSAWEVGKILGITKRTVDEHVQTAIRKLGAANRTHAVAIALRNRLIEADSRSPPSA